MQNDFFKQLAGSIEKDYGLKNTNKPLPPVEKWKPEHCGDIGLEIKKDGTWFHQGSPFTRKELVALFSTILRKDADGNHYLVTPHEKVIVHVEDAPFTIIRADLVDEYGIQQIVFTTNIGDIVKLDKEHELIVKIDENQNPRPYVQVRANLFALINRNVFYELVEWAKVFGNKMILISDNAQFELGEIE